MCRHRRLTEGAASHSECQQESNRQFLLHLLLDADKLHQVKHPVNKPESSILRAHFQRYALAKRPMPHDLSDETTAHTFVETQHYFRPHNSACSKTIGAVACGGATRRRMALHTWPGNRLCS